MRAAVAAYLESGSLPFVGTVYPARTYINEEDYEETMNGVAVAASSSGSNAVLVVNMPDSDDQRRADVGRNAVMDTDVHQIWLEVFFACVGGDPVAAQNDHDTICDAIKTHIRADATLGGQVWSAGEFRAGVKISQKAPYTDADGTVVFIPTTVRFEVWEWISGSGG